MWSPINSEPSSPLRHTAKHKFPVRDASTAISSYNNLPRIEVSRSIYDGATRPLCPADFMDSDDEDDVSDTESSYRLEQDAGAGRQLRDILECPEAEMRKIQLWLQAKILREIAELAPEADADRGP